MIAYSKYSVEDGLKPFKAIGILLCKRKYLILRVKKRMKQKKHTEMNYIVSLFLTLMSSYLQVRVEDWTKLNPYTGADIQSSVASISQM